MTETGKVNPKIRKSPPSPPLSPPKEMPTFPETITKVKRKRNYTKQKAKETPPPTEIQHMEECVYCRDRIMHERVINALNSKRFIPSNGNANWEYTRSQLKLNASSMSSILNNNWFCSFEQSVTNKIFSAVIERGPDVYHTSPETIHPIRAWNPDVFKAPTFVFAPEKFRNTQVNERVEEHLQKMSTNISRGKRHEGDAMIAYEQVNPNKHVVIDEFKPYWMRKQINSNEENKEPSSYSSSTMIFANTEVFEGQLGVTPDGITYCGLVVEYKCPNVLDAKKLSYYNDQIQSALHILELDNGVLFQYDVKTGKTLSQNVGVDQQWVNKSTDAVTEWIARYQQRLDDMLNPKFLHLKKSL